MNIQITHIDRLDEVIRAAMKQVIHVIQTEAANFAAKPKVGYNGKCDDLVTTADYAAQRVYVEYFTRELPGIGLVGEEEGLKLPCTIPGENIYITIDPVDGTKAFARNQSFGVGTMVGVVRDTEIIAAFVGDVNTGEIYGFSPTNPHPTRTRFGVEQPLVPYKGVPLAERYLLGNAMPGFFRKAFREFFDPVAEGGIFKNAEVTYGSYGVFCARLWKGEVAALLFDPAHTTPWDEVPVLGMARVLGLVYFQVDPETLVAEEINQELPPLEPVPQPMIIIMTLPEYAPAIRQKLDAIAQLVAKH